MTNTGTTAPAALSNNYWDSIITPKKSVFELNLREVWHYRDLMMLFVKRDYAQQYKQTVLGPAWFFLQPLFTTLIFTVVFGNLAGISTDGIPPMLFYLAGITNWNYFADSLNKTSTTFKDNQAIFGKVYFARLTVPIAIVIFNLIKYGIQFFLFAMIYLYFVVKGTPIAPNAHALLFPLLIVLLAGLGLGFGLLITAMTTKYRDLMFIVQFGVQLFMYATPVIYPLSEVPEKYRFLAALNPLTSIIETFKVGFIGVGTFDWGYLAYSTVFTVVLLFIGIVFFNKTERNFIDTV
jgi:lipopolysaccharide transport system permease protein